MLLSSPVLHHEAEAVRVEEQPLAVARTRRTEVDEENDRELQALGRVNRQQRHGVRRRDSLERFADRQVGIDDLVQVPHEISDARKHQVAFEEGRELEHLAQVEERAGAAVPLRAQLRPAQVSGFLEQPVEDVGDGQRVTHSTEPVGDRHQRGGLLGDARLHLRKAFAP